LVSIEECISKRAPTEADAERVNQLIVGSTSSPLSSLRRPAAARPELSPQAPGLLAALGDSRWASQVK